MRKLILLLGIMFAAFSNDAQTCGTCTVNITGLDSSAYTVSSSQTLCIDTTGNFIGTINLDGGTICNKGLFNPKSITFLSGTIDNYGNLSLSSLTLIANRILNNKHDAITNIIGNLILSGGVFVNNGIINISQALENNTGTINNTGILNCSTMSGSNGIANTGILNTN